MLIGTNPSSYGFNLLEAGREAAFSRSRRACNWTGNLLTLLEFRLAVTRAQTVRSTTICSACCDRVLPRNFRQCHGFEIYSGRPIGPHSIEMLSPETRLAFYKKPAAYWSDRPWRAPCARTPAFAVAVLGDAIRARCPFAAGLLATRCG